MTGFKVEARNLSTLIKVSGSDIVSKFANSPLNYAISVAHSSLLLNKKMLNSFKSDQFLCNYSKNFQ